jgi:tetratricopeptide (TPR) repeat protein
LFTSSKFSLWVIVIVFTAGVAHAQHSRLNADAYNKRGVTYHEKSYYYRAISDFTKAIKIAPLYAIVYYNRANVYANLGRYDKAIKDFNKALQIDPSYAMAYYNRGITYFLKQDYDKAWKDINKVKDLGTQIHPTFLEMLREESEQER